MKMLIERDLADDVDRPVDQLSTPRATGAADDQRNAGAAGGAEKLGDFTLDYLSRAKRLRRAEVGGTGVGGTGVDRDDMGLRDRMPRLSAPESNP